MLRQIATYVLALAIVLGTTLQAMASASAAIPQPSMTMSDVDMAKSDYPNPPCKGMTPICIDSLGCVINIGVPAASPLASIPFEWGVVSYFFSLAALAGVSIEPELSPPIIGL